MNSAQPFALPESRTGFLVLPLGLMGDGGNITRTITNPDLRVILGFYLFLPVLGIISRAICCQGVCDHNLLILTLQSRLSASLSLGIVPCTGKGNLSVLGEA